MSGAERGSEDQQGYGLLTEMVIRKELGLKVEKIKINLLLMTYLHQTV